jgi:hypothetical protein
VRPSLDFELVSWQGRVRLACAGAEGGDGGDQLLRDLAYELGEAFADEVTIAITKYLRDLMRSWRADEGEILAIAQQKGILGTQDATWERFLVELIDYWISDLRGELCRLHELGDEAVRDHVRGSLYRAIFVFLVFVLKGTRSSPEDDTTA